jgi:3-isopropylmalate/(R)-2-methylmalate dehydratase small subunit
MMRAFDQLEGVVAPFLTDNIDTDQLCPKQHLKRLERAGFGDALFSDQRFDAAGNPRSEFLLNRAPWNRSRILLAGDNFACGSSREHAVWSLVDFGIRCVIAPSFADIFFQNSVNSGLLAIRLPRSQVADLVDVAQTHPASHWRVDLPRQLIIAGDAREVAFDIEPERKTRLLQGLDEIGLTLRYQDQIDAFEARQRLAEPWLWMPIHA